MNRIILHLDFDSFFASVAQQENPSLRGVPVGVTATNGRTCIIAASREAKRRGSKSPSRTHDAKRICPNIVFVPADFVKYIAGFDKVEAESTVNFADACGLVVPIPTLPPPATVIASVSALP